MLGGWDSSYIGVLELPGAWLNSEESHRYSKETTQERLALLQRQHHRGDESWTLGWKTWGAYLTYQSRRGHQVLQASLSRYVLQGTYTQFFPQKLFLYNPTIFVSVVLSSTLLRTSLLLCMALLSPLSFSLPLYLHDPASLVMSTPDSHRCPCLWLHSPFNYNKLSPPP